MKKIILASALMFFAQLSFGQFTQAANNSGFTTNCDNAAGPEFSWAFYGPACTGPDNGGGGTDESAVNELTLGWGQASNGKIYCIYILTTPLDLSSAANQKMKVTLRSLKCTSGCTTTPTLVSNPLTYNVTLEDASGNLLDPANPVNVAVTGTNQQFNLDFSTHIGSGKNLSVVKKIIFIYDGCPSATVQSAAKLIISNFQVGSLITTGVTDSEGVLAGANLFPNPSNGLTTITAELPSSSAVKVSLMDMYGREVKVITEGNFNSINTTFDVSDLAKGIYTVNYLVNGKATKVQKLVVR